MTARCDYCPRPAIVTVHLRQGLLRAALGLPPRQRAVCVDHILRATRSPWPRG